MEEPIMRAAAGGGVGGGPGAAGGPGIGNDFTHLDPSIFPGAAEDTVIGAAGSHFGESLSSLFQFGENFQLRPYETFLLPTSSLIVIPIYFFAIW